MIILEPELDYFESGQIIQSLRHASKTIASQIACNDKYSALHLEKFNLYELDNFFYRFFLGDQSQGSLYFKILKVKENIESISYRWLTVIKPRLFHLFENFEALINLYSENFSILLVYVEEKRNNKKVESLRRIEILVEQLIKLKNQIICMEENIIDFTSKIEASKYYLQSNFFPYLNKLIAKEEVSIHNLQGRLIDIQSAIDFTEKKIMDIEISLAVLCITLAMASYSGNIFLIFAEIISIAALAITDIVFHEKLSEYKKEKISIMSKLHNECAHLNYLINLHNDFQMFLKEYSQLGGIFSKFKNSLYELETLLNIIANKFSTAYKKIENENYSYLKATLRVINLELTNLKDKLKENCFLHNLPVHRNLQNASLKMLNSSNNLGLLIPNRLYFQYQINKEIYCK